MARRLGQILVDMGYLDEEKLWSLLEEQKRSSNELIGKVGDPAWPRQGRAGRFSKRSANS